MPSAPELTPAEAPDQAAAIANLVEDAEFVEVLWDALVTDAVVLAAVRARISQARGAWQLLSLLVLAVRLAEAGSVEESRALIAADPWLNTTLGLLPARLPMIAGELRPQIVVTVARWHHALGNAAGREGWLALYRAEGEPEGLPPAAQRRVAASLAVIGSGGGQ